MVDTHHQVLAERVEWSIFKHQLKSHGPLAIQVLRYPKIDSGSILERGVLIVGNETLDDLISASGPRFKDYWFIISTSLSHRIPTNGSSDLQMFANLDGLDKYLSSSYGKTPYFPMQCGMFIDTEFFTPSTSEIIKKYDVVCVSKWHPPKRIELLLEALKLAGNEIKACFVSVPIPGGGSEVNKMYEKKILGMIDKLKNVELIRAPDGVFRHSDGTYVPGGLTPEELRNIYRLSRSIALMSSYDEGVNRSICEGVSCNIPAIVTDDLVGGTKRIIDKSSGIFVKPNPENVLQGIRGVVSNINQFEPRKWFTNKFGEGKANFELVKKVVQVSTEQGNPVGIEGWKNYNGGPWTMDYYDVVCKYSYT